jgi:hypothetical protein
MPAPEIITDIPQDFIDDFRDEILGTIPEEKVQCELRQVKIARVMQAVGSIQVPGLGQQKAVIDGRLFHRLHQAYGQHEGWLDDFLADNPHMCSPGYKPKQRGIRHGKTFIDGKPV